MLGIFLICYSSRGHQLVFAYPPSIISVPVAEQQKQRSFLFPGVDFDNSSSVSVKEKYLGFDSQTLSDLLSPKVALCDKKFELTVDHVTFVGHATLLNADRPGTGNRFARFIQKNRMLRSNSSVVDSSQDVSQVQPSTLTMFNVVIALDGSEKVDLVYKHVICKVAAALKYEQLKRSFIRKEAEIVMSLKEKFYPLISTGKMSHEQLTEKILMTSSLASSLAQLFDDICTKKSSHLTINDTMDLSVILPKSTNDSEIECVTRENYEYPTIEPFHSLILLADPEEVLKNLPFDCSPLLVQLVNIVSPTQSTSLEELQVKLECSLPHLLKLASHLIYWNKAKLISVISTRNVYVPSPKADLALLSHHQIAFSGLFPNMKLLDILSQLRSLQPFSAIIPSKAHRTLYLEALAYLLRHDLVVHLQMYIYISVPAEIRSKVHPAQEDYIIPNPSQLNEMEAKYIELIASMHPAPLSLIFSRFFHGNTRLLKYFDGKRSVDEILILENLPRKDFKNFLVHFKPFLITSLGISANL